MMKNINFKMFKNYMVMLTATLIIVGCDRDLSDEAVEAGLSSLPDIFTDNFVGLGSNFYFPYADSKLDAFSVDSDEGYNSQASIRIDVPNANDPNGNYAGAIFRIDGAGRDLSGYDALTFWAKASQGITIEEIGFGEDFMENKYMATRTNISVGTNWAKYIIPIPDPSKLNDVRGVLRYAAGTQNTGGFGYAFWLDEIKFENLGTIAQPRPKILNGNNEAIQTFIGAASTVTGLSQTFNLGSGEDITVIASPSYFEFMSSNPSVATVDELGNVSIMGSGTATITATLADVDAQGSLTIESLGEFTPAPIPEEAPENVISVFSDAYDNVPVDYYNGFFNGDGQTTQGGTGPGGADVSINGDGIINYTQLNFVGIGTFMNVPNIDASSMTHLHVDLQVNEDIDSGDFIRIQLINSVGNNETSGSVTLSATQLISNGWASFDIALGEFIGLGNRSQLGLLFFISDATISDIYVDNIYFYREVVEPSPNVDDSGATEVALPIGFESPTLTYEIGVFSGTDSAIETNPDQSGINPTSMVLRSTKTNGAEFFAGTTLELDSPIDFSTSQIFRMKVWSPKTNIPVRIKLENSANPAQFVELDANTTVMNEWEELEWDFSGTNFNIAPLDRVVIFFEFSPGVPGDGSTYYCDDLKILN